MDHIVEWERINAAKSAQDDIEREHKKKKDEKRIVKIKDHLAKHEAENVTTNGYVWHFDYKGMSCDFCDQEDRIVGEIHRPFISESDHEEYRDKRSYAMGEPSISFITEYCHQHFCIQGQPWRSLNKVLSLIQSTIAVRRNWH